MRKKFLEFIYHWSSKLNVWSWQKLYGKEIINNIKAEIQIWSLYYRTEIVWFIIGFTVGFILGALIL